MIGTRNKEIHKPPRPPLYIPPSKRSTEWHHFLRENWPKTRPFFFCECMGRLAQRGAQRVSSAWLRAALSAVRLCQPLSFDNPGKQSIQFGGKMATLGRPPGKHTGPMGARTILGPCALPRRIGTSSPRRLYPSSTSCEGVKSPPSRCATSPPKCFNPGKKNPRSRGLGGHPRGRKATSGSGPWGGGCPVEVPSSPKGRDGGRGGSGSYSRILSTMQAQVSPLGPVTLPSPRQGIFVGFDCSLLHRT